MRPDPGLIFNLKAADYLRLECKNIVVSIIGYPIGYARLGVGRPGTWSTNLFSLDCAFMDSTPGYPLSGPATPPSPPTTMSVSARASASTDGGVPTSPVFSPQPRGNGRPPLSRLYRPGIRSLDSGLDLSSPTIGHTALLIKETVDRQIEITHAKRVHTIQIPPSLPLTSSCVPCVTSMMHPGEGGHELFGRNG
ncbi:hypothetical protein Y032_0007g3223 [Ancylostoma ceylanicum]|uniref:Uncharacterized protein n=1 Tax=Ancylostoma ceylanicum TaxID=53326 RepID=A0A016VMA0_9BILA|nr:hypothetical protein Y032_0007g3223 [Ancylostoma ceylanicum]